MLKNLYILSEGSWGIKSSEIFADLFYSLSLFAFFLFFFFQNVNILWLPTLIFFILGIIVYFVYQNLEQPIYPLKLFSNLLISILVSPVMFFSPSLVVPSVLLGCISFYLLKKKFGIQIPIFVWILLFFYTFDFLLLWIGFNGRVQGDANFTMTFLPTLESSGIPFGFPWTLVKETGSLGFSALESLGIFVLVGVSWFSFRKFLLIFYFLCWNLLFFLWFYGMGSVFFPWGVAFASIAFFLHLAPGRNFYGSFYGTLLSFLLCLPISFLVGKIGISPLMNVIIFFSLEALVLRVFLGK
ncbi:MAG: hypothetical protein O9301_14605 [Leptospira sp.]|nr:hypothetical protein [Leptospira sp.]